MILLIDNYDSFVYNLARYIEELGHETYVVRNDAITLKQIECIKPSHIIISPGPCSPNEAGLSLEVIRYYANTIPLLGICLGHQAIGQAFGGVIKKAKHPMHGRAANIWHNERGLFANLENPQKVGRYHSLIVSEENFPSVLEVTARSEQGEIMALQHTSFAIFGLQFHPESVLTLNGYQYLQNFLSY